MNRLLLFLSILLLIPLTSLAQTPEPYAVLSEENTVLTFYYDGQKETRGGMSVTSSSWSKNRYYVEKVVFDQSFANCTSLTSTASWFSFFMSLTSIEGIENLKTDNVTDMSGMFNFCSKLTKLDVSGFKTDNVTRMDFMFQGCSALTSLDVSGFNTSNVLNMENMFLGCSALTSLDVSSFNTNNVRSMDYMFSDCSCLLSLDISNFVENEHLSTQRMFSGCSKLRRIYCNDAWNVADDSDDMFEGCKSLVGGNNAFYNENNVSGAYANPNDGYFTKTTIKLPYTCFADGTLTFYYDNQENKRNGYPWVLSNTLLRWDGHKEDVTAVVFDDSFAGYSDIVSTSEWFAGFSNMTSMTGLINLKTDNVTNMWYMFQNCSGLTSLDVSGFNTSNVTDMGGMFNGCSGLTSLNVSGFNTSNVTDMGSMFSGCSSLTNLDLSGFKTDNVTNMNSMFYLCSDLKNLDVSGFNTSNVTAMGFMFYSCSGLTSLNVSGINTSNVTDMGAMFESCSGLTSLDVSSFKTDNVTNMNCMFSGCSGLKTLNVSGFNTSNVTEMISMFGGCSGLKTLNVSGFNTSNVTRMGSMFSGCEELRRIFCNDTWNASDSEDMFSGCWSIVGGNNTVYNNDKTSAEYANPNVGGYFTRTDANLAYASFADGTLTLYYDKQEQTRNGYPVALAANSSPEKRWAGHHNDVTTVVFDASFANCTTIKSTANWFSDFTNLIEIVNLGNLKTANVTNMSSMFSGCSSLTNLDVSGFNTSNVTTMGFMFYDCGELRRIFCNDTWSTSDSEYMFSGCRSLVGGNNTIYDYDKISVAYANPNAGGYFTSTTTDLAYASFADGVLTFYYDKQEFSRNGFPAALAANSSPEKRWYGHRNDVTTVVFDASFANCTTIKSTANWFSDFTNLSEIVNLGNLKTTNVTDMSCMFSGCSGLTALDISNFNASKVTDMSSMFSGCGKLRRIYCNSSWSPSASESMFTGCYNLVGGTNTVYDDGKVTAAYANPNAGGYFTGTTTNLAYAAFANNTLTFYYDKQEQERGGYPVALATSPMINLDTKWDGHREDVTTVVFDASFADCTNITSTEDWFSAFINLDKVVNLGNLKTGSVTSMKGMFQDCAKLKRLDVSGFNTSNVEDMECMFSGCMNLKRIFCNNTWTATNSFDMFSGCYKLVGGRSYAEGDQSNKDVTCAHPGAGGYFTTPGTKLAYAVYDEGNLTFYYDMDEEVKDGCPVCLASTDYFISAEKWDDHALEVTTVTFDNSFASCTALTGIAGLFAGLDNLTKIINLQNLKTDNVTSMKGMFASCVSLITLDLTKLNTSKVTNMEEMFANCIKLDKIYCNTVWTAEESKDMFMGCTRLAGNDGTQYKDGNATVEFAKPDGGYFTRTLNAIDGKYWMTYFTWGQNVKADENTTVYIGELNDTKDELTLHEIADGIISSGQGVILMSTVEAPMLYLVEEKSGTGDYSNNALRGSDDTIETSSVDGTVYTLAVEKEPKELGFYKYKGEKLLAHKAYLAIPSSQDAIRMVFDDNGFTGIKDTQRDADKKAERYFDLQGRPVANPTKGLYIVNGKKIVKK